MKVRPMSWCRRTGCVASGSRQDQIAALKTAQIPAEPAKHQPRNMAVQDRENSQTQAHENMFCLHRYKHIHCSKRCILLDISRIKGSTYLSNASLSRRTSRVWNASLNRRTAEFERCFSRFKAGTIPLSILNSLLIFISND